MTGPDVGTLLGAATGGGSWLVIDRLLAGRRTSVAYRVLPFVRDLTPRRAAGPPAAGASSLRGLGHGALTALGRSVERVLGGSASIQRRLDRANLTMSVHEFRMEQAVWGVVAFGALAVPAGFLAAQHPERGGALLIGCLCALALGVLLRENRLSGQAARRERRVLEELPLVAELLALAVAAGESPVAAVDRVVARSHGELAADLRRLLAAVRTGSPFSEALDDLATRSGLAPVSRFAQGLAIAVERGTPLAEVLHAQAGDVREAARRELIESGARREVLMMVPVVFLILPTVVVFAFWPGLVGLRLVV